MPRLNRSRSATGISSTNSRRRPARWRSKRTSYSARQAPSTRRTQSSPRSSSESNGIGLQPPSSCCCLVGGFLGVQWQARKQSQMAEAITALQQQIEQMNDTVKHPPQPAPAQTKQTRKHQLRTSSSAAEQQRDRNTAGEK